MRSGKFLLAPFARDITNITNKNFNLLCTHRDCTSLSALAKENDNNNIDGKSSSNIKSNQDGKSTKKPPKSQVAVY